MIRVGYSREYLDGAEEDALLKRLVYVLEEIGFQADTITAQIRNQTEAKIHACRV